MAAAPVLHTEHFLNDCSTRSDRHAFNSPTINKRGELNKEAGLMARGSEMDHHTIDWEELPPPPQTPNPPPPPPPEATSSALPAANKPPGVGGGGNEEHV